MADPHHEEARHTTSKSETDKEREREKARAKDEIPTREELQQRATELGQGPIAELTPRGMAAHCIAEEKSRRGWRSPARLESYEGICGQYADRREREEKDREKREREQQKREEARRKVEPQPAMR